MACHIRKGEIVMVVSGDHKGAQGKVLRVDPKRQLVLVEGVNVIFRHVRPSKRHPQGGRVEKEAPLHISNVLPLDSKTQRGSRVQFQVERRADGSTAGKKRVATSGAILGTVTKAQKGS